MTAMTSNIELLLHTMNMNTSRHLTLASVYQLIGSF